MAFCFACFIEQRADIHVNLVLLQSARSCGEYSALFRFLFHALSLSLSFFLFLFSSLSGVFCLLCVLHIHTYVHSHARIHIHIRISPRPKKLPFSSNSPFLVPIIPFPVSFFVPIFYHFSSNFQIMQWSSESHNLKITMNFLKSKNLSC